MADLGSGTGSLSLTLLLLLPLLLDELLLDSLEESASEHVSVTEEASKEARHLFCSASPKFLSERLLFLDASLLKPCSKDHTRAFSSRLARAITSGRSAIAISVPGEGKGNFGSDSEKVWNFGTLGTRSRFLAERVFPLMFRKPRAPSPEETY